MARLVRERLAGVGLHITISTADAFKPCDERGWRGPRLPFIFVPMPTMGVDGHYVRGGSRGDIDPELVIEPPSTELKRYYKLESTHPSPSEEVCVSLQCLI